MSKIVTVECNFVTDLECWDWTFLNSQADMEMDVRDMSAFQSESFGAIVDKGNAHLL